MGGSSFELIMQGVQRQQQLMEEMIAENHELRRQLAELRTGRGIVLNVEGIQFTLGNEEITNHSLQSQIAPIDQMNQDTSAPATFEATPATSIITVPMGTIPETPYPSTDEFDQIPQFTAELEMEDAEVALPSVPASSFLEDMLIDEFAAAATSPMAVWKSPAPITRKLTAIDLDDESQKATLRKELIGSFLLE